MNLRFLVLIRGMRHGGETDIFLCLQSEVAYLVRVDCLYLMKPLVVGFCWRCNWTVG